MPWEVYKQLDGCKHAKDGTCDEPYLCNKLTDSTDCGMQCILSLFEALHARF